MILGYVPSSITPCDEAMISCCIPRISTYIEKSSNTFCKLTRDIEGQEAMKHRSNEGYQTLTM